jgi:hypothetical protein
MCETASADEPFLKRIPEIQVTMPRRLRMGASKVAILLRKMSERLAQAGRAFELRERPASAKASAEVWLCLKTEGRLALKCRIQGHREWLSVPVVQLISTERDGDVASHDR